MRSHPSSEQLHAWVSCLRAEDRDTSVSRHVVICDRCREYAARATTLRERVSALPLAGAPPRDLWPSIERRIADAPGRSAGAADSESGTRRPLKSWWEPGSSWHHRAIPAVALAAAMVASFGLGRLSTYRGLVPSRASERKAVYTVAGTSTHAYPDSLTWALAVQETGTAYLSAIASLARAPDPRSSNAYQGKQAAVAVMQGAALELAQTNPADRHIAQLAALLSTMRSTGDATDDRAPSVLQPPSSGPERKTRDTSTGGAP
jgi:hypothetical protein